MIRKTRSLLTSVFALMFMLCAFVFGLTLMPTQTAKADGETMLTEMNFTVTTPADGNKYDTNIVSAEPEKYTATFDYVWDVHKNREMTNEETFSYGGEYAYIIYITAESGFTFDEDTPVYLNDVRMGCYTANHRYVNMKVPLKIEVIGGHLYTDVLYEEIKTGETYTYEYGYLYADSAPEGMVFHKWKRTNVKTSEVDENYSGSQKMQAYFDKGSSHYVYEAVYAIPLDNIEINIPIEEGKKLEDLVPVGLDANKDNYTIEITNCYYYDAESNVVTLSPTDTFEQGERYNFDFYIHSKEGYIYSQTSQITVNGEYEYRNATNWLDNYSYYSGADLYDLVPITLDVTDGVVYKDGVVTEEREFLAGTTVTVVIDESKYPEGEVFRKWNVSNDYWVSYGDSRCKELEVTIKKPSDKNKVVSIYPTYAELWGINRIYMDVIHPEPGKTPSDYIASSYSDYFAEIVGWYLNGELLAPDYVFVEGETYTVRMKATAAPSYYFEDPQTYTYYIYHEFSGAPADEDEEIVEYEENGEYIIYDAQKMAKPKQAPANVTIAAPEAGKVPSNVITYGEDVKCDVVFDCWEVYDSEQSVWRELTDEDVFKVGETYRIYIYFYGNGEVYLCEEEFFATINGGVSHGYSFGTSGTNYVTGYYREYIVEASLESYDIIVENGEATIDSLTVTETGAGVIVTITANTPESGYAFKMWVVTSGENVFLVDARSSTTTFIMPASDVTVTAVYRYIPNTITVTGGVADWTEAGKEETITITLGEVPTNQYFSHWVVKAGGVTLEDENAKTTTFVMGEEAVEIEAVFEEQTYIARLDFTFGALKDGFTTVDDLVSADPDKYTAEFDTIKGNGVDYSIGEAFIGGESYIFYFYLEIDEKCRIDSGTTIYINGNKYCYLNTVDGRLRCHAYLNALRTVTVVNGKAYEDSECTILLTHAEYCQYFYVVADDAPAGMQFTGWEIDGDNWRDDSSKQKMNVRQYDENLTITAIYKTLYTITVTTAGSADCESAVEGTKVTLTRGENPEGKYQIGWSINGGEMFTSDYFTMPNEDVEVTPVYHTHVYNSWNSNSSYHWQYCEDPYCPNYSQSRRNYEEHTYDHDCDNICNKCEYVRSTSHDFTGEWIIDDEYHWHVCETEGCEATDTKVNHSVSSAATCQEQAYCSVCSSRYGEIDADNHEETAEWTKTPTTHEKKYTCCDVVVIEEENHHWVDGVCSECEYECTHTGGTATCITKAECSTCGESYGPLDADNHTGTAEWTKTPTTHEKKYTCCDGVVVEEENHHWNDGVCSECEYECTHTGGTATCITKAECSTCGEKYGSFDADNHEDEVVWYITATTHEKYYDDCCGQEVIAEESHNFEGGICSVCELNTENIINSVVINELKAPLYNQTVGYFYYLLEENIYTTLTINGEVLNEDTDLFGNIYLWDFALFDENGDMIEDTNHIITSGTYYLGLALVSVPGYPFADDVTVTVNGATSVETDLYYDLIVYAEYEVTHTCVDTEPKDHLCDLCEEELSQCEDVEPKDHLCDVCGEELSQCTDVSPKDHVCDICGEDEMGTHEAATGKHTCDYCGETVSQCEDVSPKDHVCDICGEDEMGTHEAATGKHTCDYCGETVSQCTDVLPKDHVCDVCGETVSSHVDEDDNGICDVCEEQLGSGDPESSESTEESENTESSESTEESENTESFESSEESKKDGLSGGAIAGIAIGSTAAAGVGGFGIFWFVIKKKSFADLIAIIKKK